MVSSSKKRPCVLVTGFPNLLARGLVAKALAASPQVDVILLVTGPHADAARQFRRIHSSAEQRRLKLMVADWQSVDLGLSGHEVQRLTDRVTHIFHAIADPSGSVRTQRARLAGLRQVMRLARDCERLERFCFFSTAFVSGSRTGLVREEELDCGQTLRSPYERFMMAAEKVIRVHMPRVPCTILRPSAMIGHSRTGDSSGLTEGPAYLLSLMLRLPTEVPVFLPGSGVVPFNIVPVDYVVNASWYLAGIPSEGAPYISPIQTYECQTRTRTLSRSGKSAPTRFGTLALGMMRGILRQRGLPIISTHSCLLGELTQEVTYCCAGALERLAATDIQCPPFDTYADVLVIWMARLERERRMVGEAS